MVAVAVTVVVAMGTLCYQYQGVRQSRISQAEVAATRIGQMLLEDWKSTGGDSTYDPTELGLGFTTPPLGCYGTCMITLDNQTFYIQLTQQLANQLAAGTTNPDPVANVTLNQLNVTVRWRNDFTWGVISGNDPSVSLTTYVRRDG
jgi:hypothetical protein